MSKKVKEEDVQAPVQEAEATETFSNGSFLYPDGSKYSGDYKTVDGVKYRHGHGVFTFGPEQYDGEWINDTMEGRGVYSFSSGAVYTGDFKQNCFSGEGSYAFPDGASYIGSWSGGKMHGNGTYTDPDGVKW
eukprot:CAMPEP_0185035028 /NCGR_PEP_ID=MMETSP1103-20130426/25696_1 /TAXON_ID=36769 /ORGANISM="Paraphysomonas bandaiensis, Strain Caron Lab Isolate" /LENGTH=131 /DNA_ID=CAMNT_0027571931 /DNA_START=51 /DNA_END=443 /DNA_ORIENTATION=+